MSMSGSTWDCDKEMLKATYKVIGRSLENYATPYEMNNGVPLAIGLTDRSYPLLMVKDCQFNVTSSNFFGLL